MRKSCRSRYDFKPYMQQYCRYAIERAILLLWEIGYDRIDNNIWCSDSVGRNSSFNFFDALFVAHLLAPTNLCRGADPIETRPSLTDQTMNISGSNCGEFLIGPHFLVRMLKIADASAQDIELARLNHRNRNIISGSALMLVVIRVLVPVVKRWPTATVTVP